MSETNSPADGTIAPPSETNDPFRVTIAPAVGPNVDGHAHMARAAHAPDPAIVDDPEAPDVAAPTPTQE